MKTQLFILLIFWLGVQNAYAQIAISADPVGGKPLTGAVNPDIEGSPYLWDQWEKGDVHLKNGVVWKDLDLRIDLYEKRVIFKNSKNEELAIVQPVEYVIFKNSELSLIRIVDNRIYQELVKGEKLVFLKHIAKVTIESKDYASSRAVKTFTSNSEYFIISEASGIKKIKLSKKDFEANLPQFASDIRNFASKVKLKSLDDFIELVKFINRN